MKRPLLLVLTFLALACEKKSGPRPDPDPPQPSPQTPAAPPVVQATVHSRGTFPVVFEGVLIDAPKPNESGPYVFASVDLDEGSRLPGAGAAQDLGLGVDARTLRVGLSTPNGLRGLSSGAGEPSADQCISGLAASQQALNVSNQAAPSEYFCVQTAQGRTSMFRVLNVSIQPETSPRFFRITATFEHTTWDKEH